MQLVPGDFPEGDDPTAAEGNEGGVQLVAFVSSNPGGEQS